MSKRMKWMEYAHQLANESKCVSNKVGAVLVKNGAIISSGVNGSPVGFLNCCDKFHNYDPETDRDAHHEWSLKHELHAEMNLIGKIVQNKIDIDGSTLYVTMQPCSHCCLMLAAVQGINEIIYDVPYDKGDTKSLKMLENVNMPVCRLPYTEMVSDGRSFADVVRNCTQTLDVESPATLQHELFQNLDTVEWFEFEVFHLEVHNDLFSGENEEYSFDLNCGRKRAVKDGEDESAVSPPMADYIGLKTKSKETVEALCALSPASYKISKSDPAFDVIMDFMKVLSL